MDFKIFPIRTLNFLRLLPQGSTNAISLASRTSNLQDSSPFPPPAASSPSPNPPSGPPVDSEKGLGLCSSSWSTWCAPSDSAFLEGTQKFGSTDTTQFTRQKNTMASLGAGRPVLGRRRDVQPYTLVTTAGPGRVCWGPPPLSLFSGLGALQVSPPAIPARPPRRAR